MKTLTLSVGCASAMTSDIPDEVRVEITPTLAARIRELAAAVRSVGALSIEEFCYEPDWYNNEKMEQVDGTCLCVGVDRFWFIAVPHHCDNDLELTTEEVPLKDIEEVS